MFNRTLITKKKYWEIIRCSFEEKNQILMVDETVITNKRSEAFLYAVKNKKNFKVLWENKRLKNYKEQFLEGNFF